MKKNLMISGMILALLLPQAIFAKEPLIRSIFQRNTTKEQTTVSWEVDNYTIDTESWLYLRKKGNRRWKKIDQRGQRKVEGGRYKTIVKRLRPATQYELYIEADTAQSAIYPFMTNPRIRLSLKKDVAIIEWKMPKRTGYIGHIRWAKDALHTTTPWTEAMPRRRGSQFIGAVLAPLEPASGYQYQIQIRTKSGLIVYTSEPLRFATAR